MPRKTTPPTRRSLAVLLAGLTVCLAAATPVGLSETQGSSLPPMGSDRNPSRQIVVIRSISPTPPPPITDQHLFQARLDVLFDAIRTVESGNNDWAVGDGGSSRGPYQITRYYWRDAIHFGQVDWAYYSTAYSRPHCEQVMIWFWQLHCPDALDRYLLGEMNAAEILARIHNGGPTGMQKSCTHRYWRRVQALLP